MMRTPTLAAPRFAAPRLAGPTGGPVIRQGLPFRLIFGASFLAHLVLAVAARLRPAARAARPPRSVLAEAREASVTIAQLAFAG